MAESETGLNAASASGRAAPTGFGPLLLIALCFGIFAGLVEGSGLILFQRLNWPNWGAMLHVSAPILWISPLIDVAFFFLLACLVEIVAKIFPRISRIAVATFFLTFLSAYDWLTLTARLYHRGCLLLALGIATASTRWAARNASGIMRFAKRTLPALVILWVIAFIAIRWGGGWGESRELARLPAAQVGSPNVLMIVIDTLRADHLASYGYARQTSPNIDRIAAGGVLFENAISPSSWSLPSHASLFTGRYQFEHGIADIPPMTPLGLRNPPMNGLTTLAEVLETRGYRTGAFSANRVNVTANLGFGHGFTHFEDYFQSPADAFLRTLYGREFARFYLNRTEHSKVKRLLRRLKFDPLMDRSDEGSIKSIGALGVQKRAATVNQELLQWIDSGRGNRPFFGFLNYIDVHHPYGGPPSFNQRWKDDTLIDQYDDGIRYVDDCIADLMRALQIRGLASNTLLIITSDHGESLGDHSIAFHGEALYREQTHVPLIFWFPGQIPAGARVPTPVSNASVPATLVSFLNLPPVPDFRRPPVDALWKNSPVQVTANVLSEVAQLYPASDEDIASQKVVPVSMDGPMQSLVTERWQIISHRKFGPQLYDYTHDSAETRDLFWSNQHQETAGDLLLQMQSTIAGHDTTEAAAPIGNGLANAAGRGFYRVAAAPGSIVNVELRRGMSSNIKAVWSIFGMDGKLLKTCRNPGDDGLAKPGVSDLTPEAFDDLCFSATGGSKMEILVPGASRTPVELYVRVSDWDSNQLPSNYEIAVSGAASQ